MKNISVLVLVAAGSFLAGASFMHFATRLSWISDMANQPSIKPQEQPFASPPGTVPVDLSQTAWVMHPTRTEPETRHEEEVAQAHGSGADHAHAEEAGHHHAAESGHSQAAVMEHAHEEDPGHHHTAEPEHSDARHPAADAGQHQAVGGGHAHEGKAEHHSTVEPEHGHTADAELTDAQEVGHAHAEGTQHDHVEGTGHGHTADHGRTEGERHAEGHGHAADMEHTHEEDPGHHHTADHDQAESRGSAHEHGNNDRHGHEMGPGAETQNPVAATTASITRGRQLFETYCAVCHGPEGKGGMPIAAKYPKIPTYTPQLLRRESNSHLYSMVTRGHGPMPGYAEALLPEERWHVINYLRSLQNQ